MVAIVGADGEQRMGVRRRRAPAERGRIALCRKVFDERRQTSVVGIARQEGEHGERRLLDGFGRLQRGEQRVGAVGFASEGECAGETGTRQRRECPCAIVETEHPILFRHARQRERVAGVGGDGRVGRHRPALQELHHLCLRLRFERLPGLLGLHEKMRRVERDILVPRRIVAVRPHHKVVLANHRRDALDARRHVGRAVRRGARAHGVQDAARRDEREDARGGLLQAAMRIVRQPFERGDELADRRAGHRNGVADERPWRVERALLARREAHSPGRFAPRHGRTNRQFQRLLVRLAATAGREADRHLSRCVRGGKAEADVRRTAVREAYRSRRGMDGVGDFGDRAAAVMERQRDLERVAGGREAWRVRLHDDLGRHLAPDGRRARRAVGIRERRHAHLAGKLRQTERGAP